MIRRISAVSAALTVASLVVVSPAGANHGDGIHWRGPGDRTVYVTDKTNDAQWQVVVDRAVKMWDTGVANVTLVHRLGSGSCAMNGGDIQVCLGGTNSGVAHWSYDPSTRHFSGATVNLSSSASRYGDALACHELGHALGLAHRQSGELQSCMTAAVRPEQVNADQHDFDTVFAQGNH